MKVVAHQKYGTSERKITYEVAPRRSYYIVSGDLKNLCLAFRFFIYHLPCWSYYYFRFTTTTIDFRCCKRSCDVSHTSFVSDDLENVRLAFWILNLLFTVPSYYYFRFTMTTIDFRCCSRLLDVRTYFHCVGRPRKYMHSSSKFSVIIYRSGVITILLLCLLPVQPQVAQHRSPHVIDGLFGIYVDIFWISALYYSDADERRTKLVSWMFYKLGGATVK
jgi:hypothetical protein